MVLIAILVEELVYLSIWMIGLDFFFNQHYWTCYFIPRLLPDTAKLRRLMKFDNVGSVAEIYKFFKKQIFLSSIYSLKYLIS